MLPARIKSIISAFLVGGFVFLFPFENKFLLFGILFGLLIYLGKEINLRNEFFLLSMFELSFLKIFLHPWITVIGVMILWWFGNSMI